ncbi:MAG: ThuA domain-containing protein [Actinomycetota bacterium]
MGRVWIVTGGHPFEAEPLLDAVGVAASGAGAVLEHVEQPEALDRIRPGAEVDAIVFYDMPGLRFTRDPDDPVEFVAPPPGYLDGLRTMLADGIGMVFMHHAIASWPTSRAFAELIGGRFHYQPGTLRGADYPDSGYLFDVTHTVEVLDPDHDICADLPASFELTDELYCFPVNEFDVRPLMRTTHSTDSGHFFSAEAALLGWRNERPPDDDWSHRPGSDLVAWTREPSPGARLAYLQFGDGPVTYANPTFRGILANAIGWAGS